MSAVAGGPASLDEAVALLARTPHLLVCCDYDGTLAPIVEDPAAARPLPEAVAALRTLAALPQTATAVVSGRALRDLAALSRLPAEVHLVGSHGTEFDLDFGSSLSPEQAALRHELCAAARRLAATIPGMLAEEKPAGVAVHMRRVDPGAKAAAQDAVEQQLASMPGVHVMRGKEVVEMSVVVADKGSAVDTLRHGSGASATLFIGDDVTDETAFARLHGADVGIKVGSGPTAASLRLPDPVAVVELLMDLAVRRRAWFTGGNAYPIEDHALLSDGCTLALLDPAATVNWLCHPEPHSPALFAALLGDPQAGYFSVRPASGAPSLSQTYVRDTMTVRTRWAGLTVLDYLAAGEHHGPADSAGQPLAPWPATLIRRVTGSVPAVVHLCPRPEFGAAPIWFEEVRDGLVVRGGAEPVAVHSPGVSWRLEREGRHVNAVASIDPAGGPVVIRLLLGQAAVEQRDVEEAELRDASDTRWRTWVADLDLPVRYRDAVARSALVLKALTFAPTGAMLAAATTSLPEWPGGVRNWDYRYCWIRDAAMSARALVDLGSLREAEDLLRWLRRTLAAAGQPDDLNPLYTVYGRTLGSEAIIDTLPGYAGSRPVRVGNAAQGQVQLDVFGPVLDLLAAVVARRGSIDAADDALMRQIVAAVQRRWAEPDHGIWEIRDLPRHHVHSRMMCWVAVDRAVQLADLLGRPEPEWVQLRERIRSDIEAHGYDPAVASYVSAYGRTDVDAAVLHAIAYGYPADPDRLSGTIAEVERTLRNGPVVHRYRGDDGLPGEEGGMNICTSWLVETYVRAGLTEEAEELFEALLDRAGGTGLIPEMVHPVTLRGLGNHPQAYSHLGVVRCALLLNSVQA